MYKKTIQLLTMLVASSMLTFSYASTDGVVSSEVSIKQSYVESFSDLKLIVNNNYEDEWWKPSKNEVIKKIDNFIIEFKEKSLIEYTIEDISSLSGKIDNLRLLLSKKCEHALDVVKLNFEDIGKKAKIFLLAAV